MDRNHHRLYQQARVDDAAFCFRDIAAELKFDVDVVKRLKARW